MIRTFATHKIREQEEITGSLWDFTPCSGEHKGETMKVATPSCWETYPRFEGYRGAAIYKKEFEADGNIRFEFKGVSHTATVYIDGEEVGNHYNAYTSFEVIAKNLKAGLHVLEVKADNSFSEKSALHIPNDYMSYGGVSRPVVLERIEDVYVRWVHVTPKCEDGKWTAAVEADVVNISDSKQTVTVELCIENQVAQIDVELPSEGEEIVVTEMSFGNVAVWSPENPALCNCEVYIKSGDEYVDDLIDRFGFREVELDGKNIKLNGKVVRIKGFGRHEDHPMYGCALPFSAIQADINIIKDLGANSIRTVHYPNDEIFLDLCDEQGILVWEENHARGLSLENMQNPNFEPQAEKVTEEMVVSHYNHPSIYIWGILNECASETEYGRECYRKQFDIIRKLDQSRPRSFASCKFKTDISLGLPDVVSYNIYPQWYHDTPVGEYLEDLYSWIQNETEGAGKPFLITEVGAGGIWGVRNNYEGKWSEEYQAKTLKAQLNAVLNFKGCSGVYIWQYCDVRVSEEWFDKRPRGMNNKGVVDEYRRRKLSYEVVRSIFNSFGNYFE